MSGNEANAYYRPSRTITKKLLRDLKLFPVWSNILRHRFDFGKIRATSAPVEGEIKKIKSNLMSKYKYPVRVDKFVEDHLDYLQGKTLINMADLEDVREKQRSAKETEVEPEVEPIICVSCTQEVSEIDAIVCKECNEIVHNTLVCFRKIGKTVLCIPCEQGIYDQDSQRAFDSNEVENWGGRGNPRKKVKKNTANISQIENEIGKSLNETCPACANKDKPSGAHTCVSCGKAVHVLDACSIGLGHDEGYGEKRMCLACKHTKDKKIYKVPAARNKYRKPSKYLGERKADLRDAFQWTKNKPLPLIRNGSSSHLSSITIDGKNVFLTNTCAFDSITFLTVVAVLDFPHLLSTVSAYTIITII